MLAFRQYLTWTHLSVSKTHFMTTDNNPLPRSVIRPNYFVLLNGQWSFAPDPDNLGLTEQWQQTHAYPYTAHWPGSVEAHMAILQPAQASWKDRVVAWYERLFAIPEALRETLNPNSLLQITLGACGYETRVWLNGVLLRTIEGEEIHRGEYTSFSYELEPEMLQPENRLTIRIESTMDADIPRGKQESSVYKRGGIWYQTYTGGVRSIWLETVERNRLRSRIGVVSLIEENLVRFNFTTRIHDAGVYTIKLQILHSADSTAPAVATEEYSMFIEAGQKKQRLVIEIPDAKLWTPESPNLYWLVAQLQDAAGYSARIGSSFGLRKIEARGRHIYLNNIQVYLDGILYQPGVADYEQIQLHMHAMKKLGCNLVRIHIAGVDPRIYDLADKLGLLLWVEVPSPHRSSLKSRENHKAELLRMLALMGTHASIVIWSLYNEDWGAQDIATNPETRKYITDMYHYLMVSHPEFLVVDNDGWQHISYEGRLKSDLLTAHLYTANLARWGELLDLFITGRQSEVAAFPLVVGDPFFFRKQVPLIVSEWGGFGFADYGGPNDNRERTEQIQLFKAELKKRPIAGDVYTQATDIEEERNGLIDFATAALNVPEGLLASPL